MTVHEHKLIFFKIIFKYTIQLCGKLIIVEIITLESFTGLNVNYIISFSHLKNECQTLKIGWFKRNKCNNSQIK